MKARYERRSNCISIITIDRELIFLWGRTHRSHERFSRRKWDPSWRCHRSVDCTTAMNDGLPEDPSPSRRAAFPWVEIARSGRSLLHLARVHPQNFVPETASRELVESSIRLLT